MATSPPPPGRRLLQHPLLRATLPFLIGGASGMVATCTIQPVDMVKVRLQLYGEGTSTGPRPTPLSLGRSIIRTEGFSALYAGLSAGLMRQAVYSTARLGLFDTFLSLATARAEEQGRGVTFRERAGCSLAGGGLAALIGNPTEVALIRMQSDGLKPPEQRARYRGFFDTLVRVARGEGVGALWNGAGPTAIRAMSTNFGQLAFFSETKAQLARRTELGQRAQSVVGSAVAGFFAAFFSLPFDFMKTRLQRQTRAADGSLPYNGMFDCFVKVARNEGLLRFYRGFGTYFVRIAPHSIITLIIADNLHALVKQAQGEQ